MSAPLQDRIRTALVETTTAAAVDALLPEVRTALADATRSHASESQRARDPALSADEADQASAALPGLEILRERLSAAVEKLEARAAALHKAEAGAVRAAEYDAAKAERDELAADLKSRWPELEAEMIGLLKRIHANDARLAKVNFGNGPDRWIESAEAVAREISLGAADTPERLTAARLPSFRAGHAADGAAWPIRARVQIAG